MKNFIYKVTANNAEQHLVSLLETEAVLQKGLACKSVIGHLKDGDKPLSPDNIVYNPLFMTLFQDVIRSTALASPEIEESAKEQVNGFIYIIDQRSEGKVKIKPHNIIAALEVKDETILPESLQFNPNYQVVSSEGLFILPDMYEQNLVAALSADI